MTKTMIILHWTGSIANNPTPYEFTCYHELIARNGYLYTGNPNTTQHTAGLNTPAYSISLCGGLPQTPITKEQFEKAMMITARRCKEMKIPVERVFTHYEIGQMVKNGTITKLVPNNKWLKDNIGKIDLTVLPYDVKAENTPDFIRNKIKWYISRV